MTKKKRKVKATTALVPADKVLPSTGDDTEFVPAGVEENLPLSIDEPPDLNRFPELTPKMKNAIALLTRIDDGSSLNDKANRIGVTQAQLSKWLSNKQHRQFQEALIECQDWLRKNIIKSSFYKLQELNVKAVKALEELVGSDDDKIKLATVQYIQSVSSMTPLETKTTKKMVIRRQGSLDRGEKNRIMAKLEETREERRSTFLTEEIIDT